MIKIKQPTPPEKYNALMLEKALLAQEEAIARSITSSIPNKLEPEEITILTALMYEDKCAYCETQFCAHIAERTRRIHLYKPARLYKNDTSAYAWSNVLLTCGTCHAYKGGKFPSDDNGQPEILNPYTDNPEQHLLALRDYCYGALTEKGATTIAVLGLNRRYLVEERKTNTTTFIGFRNNLAQNKNKSALPERTYDLADLFLPRTQA